MSKNRQKMSFLKVISRVFPCKFLQIPIVSVSGQGVHCIFKICQIISATSKMRPFHEFFRHIFWRVFSNWPSCVKEAMPFAQQPGVQSLQSLLFPVHNLHAMHYFPYLIFALVPFCQALKQLTAKQKNRMTEYLIVYLSIKFLKRIRLRQSLVFPHWY